MEVTGIIQKIGKTMSFGDNGFTKRELVVKLTGDNEKDEWPNYVLFAFTKERCERLDEMAIDQEVLIKFSLSGRLHTGTKGANAGVEVCYNTLSAFYIKGVNEEAQGAPRQERQQREPMGTPSPAAFDDNFDIEGSEIPF